MIAALILVAGLVLAATAASAGVAAAAVSRLELARLVSSRLRGARAAASLLENPGRVVATANACATIALLVAAAAVPAVLADVGSAALAGLTFGLVVPVFAAAAYVVPRALGRRRPERLAARAVPWLDRAERVLGPLLPRREPSNRTALAAVLAGADTDALAAADEIEIVSGVLAFADRPVAELMTPRTSLVAIPEGTPVAEAAHVFTQSGFSRFPVYRESPDEIVGIVHSRDLVRLPPEAPVPVHPALTVPGTARAADALLAMQHGGAYLAVVLDEFGGTAGVVTLEDLLTHLVRDVFAPEEPPSGAPALLELDGGAPVDELERVFGRPVTAAAPGGAGARTVGGLLVQHLGRIPRAGERFVLQGLEFDVLAASAVRVERLTVRPGPARPVTLDRPEEAAT